MPLQKMNSVIEDQRLKDILNNYNKQEKPEEKAKIKFKIK